MEWEGIVKSIKEECEKQAYNLEYEQRIIEYSKALFDKKLPIIYSARHFSMLVGLDHNYVCNMANAASHFYRNFRISKANGSPRQISEPLPDLKFVQHWILENILEKCDVSRYAKAFVKGRTLKSNARFHRSQSVVVTLDIKDFFPSITVFDVFLIFREIGYFENLSWFLANLCCLDKSLPQGAPTSPYLSNLKMRKFDEKVESYITKKNIRYTRYADDLTFSGSFNPHTVIRDMSKFLYEIGLQINSDKTRVAHKNSRQEVTGIVVNAHMQIPREKRRAIRQQVYYIRQYGLESHLNHIGELRSNYLNHLLGQINFALFVNPKDVEMQEYFQYIKAILIKRKNVSDF